MEQGDEKGMKKIDKVKIAGELDHGMKKVEKEGLTTRKKMGTKSMLPAGCETVYQKQLREGTIRKAKYTVDQK